MKLSDGKYFRLEKHYLDCIDNSGNCFIIYGAKIQFRCLSIYYSSLLFSDSRNVITEKAFLSRSIHTVKDDIIEYSHKKLGIRGSWKRTENALSAFRFKDNSNNELVWNCHQPASLAEINYSGNIFKGSGYADTVILTIEPENLPFEELRWGRFLSEKHSITWLYFAGNLGINKLFYNGTEFSDAIIENDRIVFNNGNCLISFDEKSIIREGKLVELLSGMSWLKIFFDKIMLTSFETKYKAKSTFTCTNSGQENGWSLYETVIWKK